MASLIWKKFGHLIKLFIANLIQMKHAKYKCKICSTPLAETEEYCPNCGIGKKFQKENYFESLSSGVSDFSLFSPPGPSMSSGFTS